MEQTASPGKEKHQPQRAAWLGLAFRMPQRSPALMPDSGTQPSPHCTALLTVAPLGSPRCSMPKLPQGPLRTGPTIRHSPLPVPTTRVFTAMRWAGWGPRGSGREGSGCEGGAWKGRVTKA